VLGQDLHKVLSSAALGDRDIEAKAIQYGLDMGKESDRLIAAEEVLSELAQTNPKSNLVQRAIAAIRRWIREYVPGFENMQLSDSEIIERYLVPLGSSCGGEGQEQHPEGWPGRLHAIPETKGIGNWRPWNGTCGIRQAPILPRRR
jgi:hypothetical protein